MIASMDRSPAPFRPLGKLSPAPLAAYTGRWDERTSAHLLRRAGFGGAPAEVARVAGGSMHGAVAALLDFTPADRLPSGPDLPDEAGVDAQLRAQMTGMPMAAAGATPVRAATAGAAADAGLVELRKARRMLERQGVTDLQLWWLDRMLTTPAPLQEKMTLFWSSHFTTAAIQKGVTPREILAQNTLFRTSALGNARDLTQRVAVDPAMLRYLDNLHNEATHPNENFARELMELYTLGIGNYSESDVREAARAWTGLRIRRDTGEVFVNERLHDAGSKTFLGRTGTFGGTDIVNIIFEQPATARFLATKLLSFFVYADPEPELVEAVAGLLRAHDYAVEPVMATLLSSNVFYSDRAYRALVKSPVEFVVGSYRLFGVSKTDPVALEALRRMSQILFYPPNVKGWPGGSAWLNTSTVLARENFANALMTANVVAGAGTWLRGAGTANPDVAARAIVDAIVQGDASPMSLARLQAYLAGSDTETLTALSPENYDQRMRGGAYLTMAMPAYQLA